MAKADLTAQRLRELLHYDPGTGDFHWLDKPSKQIAAGAKAGGPATGGYWRVRIAGATYLAHRLAWLYVHGEWPAEEVDHLDGNKLNNRASNLRAASRATNSQNQRRAHSRNLASGLLGVTRHKNRWAARILFNGTRKRLGMYDTPEEAHAAYVEAKRRLHAGCTI